MTILLAGASGYIGKHVEDKLKHDGYNVLPIHRMTLSSKNLKFQSSCDTDFSNTVYNQTMLESLPKVDAIISCIGSRTGGKVDAWDSEFSANKVLLDYGTNRNVTHFILLSAICVQKPVCEFQYAKLAFEQELIHSKLSYSIIRPTAFFKSLSGQINRVKAGKSFIIFDDGENTLCKPISENDLARYIVDCVTIPNRRNKILPIGGPAPAISSKTIGHTIFRILDKPPRFKSIPSKGFQLGRNLLSPLAYFSTRIKDFREFLQIAHYYATESMLLWDNKNQCYNADITPEFGTETLETHFENIVKKKTKNELGAHKLF